MVALSAALSVPAATASGMGSSAPAVMMDTAVAAKDTSWLAGSMAEGTPVMASAAALSVMVAMPPAGVLADLAVGAPAGLMGEIGLSPSMKL